MLLTLARPSEKGKECFVVIKCALVICGAGGDALKDAGVGDSELSSGRLKKRFQTAFVCRAYDYALFLTKLIVPTLVVCRFVFDMENKWMPSEKRFQTAFVRHAYDYALFFTKPTVPTMAVFYNFTSVRPVISPRIICAAASGTASRAISWLAAA